MLTIILGFILLLVAAGAFVWIVNSAINKSCPSCGPEQLVIPIIPGFLAWCPQCGDTYNQEELVTIDSSERLDADQEIFSTPEPDADQELLDGQVSAPEDDQLVNAPGDYSPGPPRF